jgi:hypothetical protein
MNARRILSALSLAAALPALAHAQQPQAWQPEESEQAGNNQYAVEAALTEWRGLHGESWRMVFEPETGYARFLYGGNAAPLFRPRSDADFYGLAREALRQTQALHGVDLGSLVEQSVLFLPLAKANSTDKMTVEFRQEVAGVPVVQGFVNVLFDLSGRLLSIDVTGLPNLGRGFSTTAAVDAGDAVSVAIERFFRDTGLPPNQLSTPALVIDQWKPADVRVPRLAWEVEVAFYGDNMNPEGYLYRVDALTGAVLWRHTTIHNDVGGNVRSPGLAGPAARHGGESRAEPGDAPPAGHQRLGQRHHRFQRQLQHRRRHGAADGDGLLRRHLRDDDDRPGQQVHPADGAERLQRQPDRHEPPPPAPPPRPRRTRSCGSA